MTISAHDTPWIIVVFAGLLAIASGIGCNEYDEKSLPAAGGGTCAAILTTFDMIVCWPRWQTVDDADVMRLLKIMLKANGQRGVPQGGVISPLLSNLYLTEVDGMLERAKETTRFGKYTFIEYARFADDLVILIDAYPRHDLLMAAVEKRLREGLADLQAPSPPPPPPSPLSSPSRSMKEESIVDWSKRKLRLSGFDFRRIRSRRGAWRANYTPQLERRTALQRKLKECFAATNRNQWGRAVDQPNTTRLGELLCGWAFQRVLQLHQRLGGKEGSAPHAARSETKGLRLDAMEWAVAVQSLRLFNGYRVRRPLPKVATGVARDHRQSGDLAQSVMMSSVIPSEKYSCSGSPDILAKGRTAIDGVSTLGSGLPALDRLAATSVLPGCHFQTRSGRSMFFTLTSPPSEKRTSILLPTLSLTTERRNSAGLSKRL